MQAPKPRVSVVVPSYNARETILEALAALQAQETREAYEVIVVDSSDDGTERLVADRFPDVRLFHQARKTLPGGARNIGVAESRGELLAFTDADCLPPSDWIERMCAAHREEPCAAVGGAIANGRRGNPVSASEWLVEFSEYLPTSPRRDVEFLPTCNAVFTRAAFERFGPFDEDLYASEDRLLGTRLRQAGERMRFEPDIVIRHLFRTEYRVYLRHQRALGAGAAVVRALYDVPDRWLVEHPARWGIGFARLLRLEKRFLTNSLKDFLLFNALLPFTASGVLAWGLGFATGRRAGEPRRAPERTP